MPRRAIRSRAGGMDPAWSFYGLYANAQQGKVRKASLGPLTLRMVNEELRPIEYSS